MADDKNTTIVEIKQKNETIKFDGDQITSVNFEVMTVDKNGNNLCVNDRSGALINKITIVGKLTGETKMESRKLAIWSLDTDEDKAYRELSIVYKSGGKQIRDFKLSKVFCVSYKEEFSYQNTDNKFTLILSQRQNELKGISIKA